MKKLKLVWLIIPALVFIGCDAMLQMTYIIHNKSDHDVTLFIPNYPIDTFPRVYGETKDTIINLKPNEKKIIGIDNKIDFPWARKNIYKNNPGICGLKKINTDSIIDLGCSKSEWKYKKGYALLKIKN